MNANDILCVGAEPIAMVDYIAVEAADDELLSEIGKGLVAGARRANITVPGGEISQIPQIIQSHRPRRGFDLVGTCIGIVDKDRLVTGEKIEPGDVILGLASSGIHSNGFTLARKALFEEAHYALDEDISGLGGSLGDELLEPTRIYVPEVLRMLKEALEIKALVHITSDGFLNLARVTHRIGFVIEFLPEPPPIFSLIQEHKHVPDSEMFLVYNMGVGFCVIASPESVERVLEIAKEADYEAWRLGHCVEDSEKRVWLKPKGLVGKDGKFFPA